MTTQFSKSEDHGLKQLSDDDLIVYSVGISTGGIAEMRMAKLPTRRIVATTIDELGLSFAKDQIADAGLTGQIILKIEDAANQLPYDDNYFDYVYARLVLHYLSKDKLSFA